MHAIQAVTALHDRYLRPAGNSSRTVAEIYHSSRSASLFNRKLSQQIKDEDLDMLMATATLIGTIAISSTDASSPEQSWPIKRSEPSDLEWIRMCEGKLAIWSLAEPLRAGTIFQALFDEYMVFVGILPVSGNEGVPAALSELCKLGDGSTSKNNPYFNAVHKLSRLQGTSESQRTVVASLDFICHMHLPFKDLLAAKDPIALLLMGLYYTTVPRSMWWIEQRAAIESQAIFLYLQQHHQDHHAIQRLIPDVSSWPAFQNVQPVSRRTCLIPAPT
jgi:hypothetical protein